MNTTIINASLPVIIEVLEKTSWWRYNLRFGKKILSTKSQVELEVGALYFANVNSNQSGVISINSLKKRPNFAFILGFENILDKILQTGDVSFLYDELALQLSLCDNAIKFEILCNCLLALNENIITLPFFYDNLYCLAQIKADECGIDFYLLFSSFAPLLARIENAKIVQIQTPYESFSNALSKALSCKAKTLEVEPLFKNMILDFQG